MSPKEPDIRVDLNGLLRDGEWGRIWQLLSSLSLWQSIHCLESLKRVRWEPQDQHELLHFRRALAVFDSIQKACARRGGLLRCERTLVLHESLGFRSVNVSNDGRYLLVGTGYSKCKPSNAGKVLVWDADTGTRLGMVDVDDIYVDRLSIDSQGSMFAASGSGGGLSVFTLPDCRPIESNAEARTRHHIFAKDNGSLITAHRHYDRSRWRASPGNRGAGNRLNLLQPGIGLLRSMQISEHAGEIWTMCVSPDWKLLAVGTGLGDHMIDVYEISSGSLIRSLTGHTDSVRKVRFSPDGKYLASASYDTTLRLWNTTDWAECASLPKQPHKFKVHFDIAFSPDGRHLAVADVKNDRPSNSGHAILLVDIPTLEPQLEFAGCTPKPDYFSFTPSGAGFVSGTIEGPRPVVNVWDAANGTLLHTVRSAGLAAVSTDGRRLVVPEYARSLSLDSEQYVHVIRLEVLDLVLLPLPKVSQSTRDEIRALSLMTQEWELETRLLELFDLLVAGP